MLHAHHLYFLRPDGSALFSDLCLHLPAERHGLVGANGIGKSVLARVLAGELMPHSGRVVRPARLGFFRQFAAQSGDLADALGLGPKLVALRAIEQGDCAERHFETLNDDWQVAERATAWLDELGLAVPLTHPFAALSGGQQTRLRLLALFGHEPDYLILDEPGNHLDRQGKAWLQQRMATFSGGMLLISHDRQLLAEVASIHELSPLGLRSYGGNYAIYRQQKRLEQQAAEQAVVTAQKALSQGMRVQQQSRERADQRASQGRALRASGSQSRLLLDMRKEHAGDHLGRLSRNRQRQQQQLNERLEQARQRLEPLRTQHIALQEDAQARPIVLRTVALSLPYGAKHTVDLLIRRGEKWHLAGANGSGKTTLLRQLQEGVPASGRIERHGRIAWLDQHLYLGDEEASALMILKQHQGATPLQTLRTRLAQIGLRAGAADRPLGLLSGGERLKLALQCCQGAALLLLDEPDNHLDLAAKTLLQTALREFSGALLLVSHDDEFVEQCGIRQRYFLQGEMP